VLADDPGLDVRLPDASRQPWRVVLDSQLRTPPEARLIHRPGRSLLLCATAPTTRRQALEAAGALVELVTPSAGAGGTGQVDLPAALRQLARLSMNEVLVEAGATLGGALLAQGLVDELIVYMAPVLLGPDARPLVQLPALARLQDSARWRYTDLRSIGDDLRLTLRPV
jgi:diaminohydroxyphosphoribosylaminopyrimidine deaminase / 5-amino-6-(5-phosphoribosylamino)uracil reductase